MAAFAKFYGYTPMQIRALRADEYLAMVEFMHECLSENGGN